MMGLPDRLRMLSLLANVELAHGRGCHIRSCNVAVMGSVTVGRKEGCELGVWLGAAFNYYLTSIFVVISFCCFC